MADWKVPVRADLADATLLVWKMQNGLAEDMSVEELLTLSAKLSYRADVIQGYIARRELEEQVLRELER